MEGPNRKNVLIAGGNGLIGTRLQKWLTDSGFQVGVLSRKIIGQDGKKVFNWDPVKGFVDPEAIPWADYIINLAGEGIADKRWSPSRKKEIIKSRTDGAELLVNQINQTDNHVKVYIAASAIGIYGHKINEVVTENSPTGNDFLAMTCSQWESSNHQIIKDHVRLVIVRIGIVLSLKGGALKEILKSFYFRMGVVFGKGNQVYSWIHVDDLCQVFLYALNQPQMTGVYNAVAPGPVTNDKFIREIALQKGGRYFIFHLPAFILKLFLGERAIVVLNGQQVSAQKIMDAGYRFKFVKLGDALKNLLLH